MSRCYVTLSKFSLLYHFMEQVSLCDVLSALADERTDHREFVERPPPSVSIVCETRAQQCQNRTGHLARSRVDGLKGDIRIVVSDRDFFPHVVADAYAYFVRKLHHQLKQQERFFPLLPKSSLDILSRSSTPSQTC